MTPKTIPVMHCFDNNYVTPAAVSFLSMLEHANPEYRYILYVLHTDITAENQEKLHGIVARFPNASLKFIDMDNKFDDLFRDMAVKGHYSKEVLYKLLVPRIFPQHDHIIISDVDVVYQGDIAPSWEIATGAHDSYIACIRTIMRPGTMLQRAMDAYRENFTPDEIARMNCCGGYLIFNLALMRRDNIEDAFINTLEQNAHRILQAEQDIINLVIPASRRTFLPLRYLVCSYAYDIYSDGNFDADTNYSADEIRHAMAHPVQLHYATHIKPWNTPDCTKAEIWYKYLAQTPFFCEQMRHIQTNAQMTFGGKFRLFGIPLVRIKHGRVTLFGCIRLKNKKCTRR